MKIELRRSNPTPVNQYIEYKTSVRHDASVEMAKIEVPKSLLKIFDLKESYGALISLGHLFEGLKGIKE
jgi:hypothetical protein